MSTLQPQGRATLYYWPSGRRGGRDVGHVALLLADGTYVSHVPEMFKDSGHLSTWKRTDVPTMEGSIVKITRWPSVRNRTLEADRRSYGDSPQTLQLPADFIHLYMAQQASGRLLAQAPGAEPLHGPLPYYQLADSVKGAGDRSQCTTTVASVLAAGVPLTHQDVGAEILAQYQPDALWDTVKALVSRFA